MTLTSDEAESARRVLSDMHESAPGRLIGVSVVAFVVLEAAGETVFWLWCAAVLLNESLQVAAYELAVVRRLPARVWQPLVESNFVWGGAAFGVSAPILWLMGGTYGEIYAFLVLLGSLLHTFVYFSHSMRLLRLIGTPIMIYMGSLPIISLWGDADPKWVELGPLILGVVIFNFYFVVAAVQNSRAMRQTREALRESQRSRRAAEAANAAKSMFLANTSHEVRTPLNGVMGMAQILHRGELDAEQRRQVGVILSSARMLTDLLNDLLDLSKIEAGKLEVSPVTANLREILAGQEQLANGQALEKGLSFSMTVSSEIPEALRFDPTRVRQCLGNLISNALKFTEAGSVSVLAEAETTRMGGRRVFIHVLDEGCGVDPEKVDSIFEPFTQADAGIARRYGGTGLGLAVSRRLARMMGGDIEVQSREAKGAAFTLTFEADAAETAPSPRGATASPTSRGAVATRPRALIVDDTGMNRMLVRMLLKDVIGETVEAESGVEALSRLEESRFDVILLDIHMPDMDGIETLRRIRAADAPWRDTPVIALTANAMKGDRETYLELGMNGYATKPVDQRVLASEILRVTGHGDDASAAKPQAAE